MADGSPDLATPSGTLVGGSGSMRLARGVVVNSANGAGDFDSRSGFSLFVSWRDSIVTRIGDPRSPSPSRSASGLSAYGDTPARDGLPPRPGVVARFLVDDFE